MKSLFLVLLVTISVAKLVTAFPVEEDGSDEFEEIVVEIESGEESAEVTSKAPATKSVQVTNPPIRTTTTTTTTTTTRTPLLSSAEDDSDVDYVDVNEKERVIIPELPPDDAVNWGLALVEGAIIKHVLEVEENDVGVSFDEVNILQKEFGRRLSKNRKATSIFGTIEFKKSGRKIADTEAGNSIRTPVVQAPAIAVAPVVEDAPVIQTTATPLARTRTTVPTTRAIVTTTTEAPVVVTTTTEAPVAITTTTEAPVAITTTSEAPVAITTTTEAPVAITTTTEAVAVTTAAPIRNTRPFFIASTTTTTTTTTAAPAVTTSTESSPTTTPADYEDENDSIEAIQATTIAVEFTKKPRLGSRQPLRISTTARTEAPTTAAPITAAPITSAPVTAAPVTAAPTRVAPVTAAPATEAPTTVAPATEAPTTVAVTAAPTTSTTTAAPTTELVTEAATVPQTVPARVASTKAPPAVLKSEVFTNPRRPSSVTIPGRNRQKISFTAVVTAVEPTPVTEEAAVADNSSVAPFQRIRSGRRRTNSLFGGASSNRVAPVVDVKPAISTEEVTQPASSTETSTKVTRNRRPTNAGRRPVSILSSTSTTTEASTTTTTEASTTTTEASTTTEAITTTSTAATTTTEAAASSTEVQSTESVEISSVETIEVSTLSGFRRQLIGRRPVTLTTTTTTAAPASSAAPLPVEGSRRPLIGRRPIGLAALTTTTTEASTTTQTSSESSSVEATSSEVTSSEASSTEATTSSSPVVGFRPFNGGRRPAFPIRTTTTTTTTTTPAPVEAEKAAPVRPLINRVLPGRRLTNERFSLASTSTTARQPVIVPVGSTNGRPSRILSSNAPAVQELTPVQVTPPTASQRFRPRTRPGASTTTDATTTTTTVSTTSEAPATEAVETTTIEASNTPAQAEESIDIVIDVSKALASLGEASVDIDINNDSTEGVTEIIGTHTDDPSGLFGARTD